MRKLSIRGRITACICLVLASACSNPEPPISTDRLPALPKPVTNNAVAAVVLGDGTALFSFLGLGAGKTWQDTRVEAFVLRPGAGEWVGLPDVPGPGRLASIAVTVIDKVYIFGGYTVATDGSEVSIPEVYVLDTGTLEYIPRMSMPVPVDDAVAFAYADRYIYLVSGWHNSGNVNLVQVYDTALNNWFQATPYPGSAVFGHAGGIAGNAMVICDGVRIVVRQAESRGFEATPECYRGEIDDADLARINWYSIPPHPGPARYRIAATGVPHNGGEIVFVGGTDNPYNFDGIGYDGIGSEPSSQVFSWSVTEDHWKLYGPLDTPTMDHRGLLTFNNQLAIVGGMQTGQVVSNEVVAFTLP